MIVNERNHLLISYILMAIYFIMTDNDMQSLYEG